MDPEPVLQSVENSLDFPRGDLIRLRLLLQRRMLWLRARWQTDPLQDYSEIAVSDAQADWLLQRADRGSEWAFYQTDAEAAHLTQVIHEQERRLSERDERLTADGKATPLQALTHIFGLTPFEQDVLRLALAPEVEPAFGRLYAYGQDDIARRLPTPELALALFTDDETTWANARSSFFPQSTLRHFALITLETGHALPLSASPFRLDDRVTDYLLGFNRLDERAAAWLREAPAEPLVETSQRKLIETVEGCIREAIARRAAQLPVINLVGPTSAGKQALAQAACGRLGARLFEVDLAALPAGPERNFALRLLAREGLLQSAGFYVEVPENVTGQTGLDPMPLLEGLGGLLFLGSDRPWAPLAARLNRAIRIVTVPRTNAVMQRKMWEQALGETMDSLNGHLDQIVEQFEFGPSQIRRVAEAITTRSSTSEVFRPEELWQACREQAGGRLDDMAQRILPCYAWEDLVLPDDILRQLREIADQVAQRAKVYEAWGFGAKLNRGRGISALFAGPSGVGKTMAAEVLANHLQLDLYRIDLSSVVSKYIGETEKNLRRVFDAAENGGAILFFDEADALFGKRSEVRDSHDRYANIEINYLLQRMEEYRGLAILATNMRSAIDSAFMRRLRFVVELPFPDGALRERIWRSVFPSQADLGKLDYALLSRWEITGGNIRNIALNAAFQAAGNNERIQMAHVVRAAHREYAKIHKLVREGEFGAFALEPAR